MSNVIFTSADTAGSAISIFHKGRDNSVVIPLSPEAAYECEKKNISYRTLESFIERDKIVAKRPVFTRSNNEWLSLVDQEFKRIIPEFNQLQFCPAKLYTMALHGFLDEFNAAQLIWSGIMHEIQPLRIYIASIRVEEPATWGRVLPQQKMIECSLMHFANADGIECIELERNAADAKDIDKPTRKSISKHVYDVLRSQISHSNRRELKLLWRVGLRSYCRSLLNSFRSNGDKKILFIGGGYDLGDLAIKLRKDACRVEIIEFPDEFIKRPVSLHNSIITRIAVVVDNLLAIRAFTNPIPTSRYSLAPSFITLFRRWAIDIVPKMWTVFYHAHHSDITLSYCGVINWAYGEGENSALVDAFRKAGIPAYCFQHGGASRNSWLTDYYQEYLQSDIYLAYGEGQRDIFMDLDSLSTDHFSKPMLIPVGSVRLDLLQKNKERNLNRMNSSTKCVKRTLLYIPTVYDHPGFTLNDSWMLGAEYFRFQLDVLEILAQHKNWKVIYKGFPGTLDVYKNNPIINVIKDRQYANIEYIDNIPITKLMWTVDRIAIDHNQTALNEILLTNKPILLLDQGSLHPWTSDVSSRSLLEETLCLAETSVDFKVMLNDFLNSVIDEVDRSKNCRFSLRYGVHKSDGLSLSRAAAAVKLHSFGQIGR